MCLRALQAGYLFTRPYSEVWEVVNLPSQAILWPYCSSNSLRNGKPSVYRSKRYICPPSTCVGNVVRISFFSWVLHRLDFTLRTSKIARGSQNCWILELQDLPEELYSSHARRKPCARIGAFRLSIWSVGESLCVSYHSCVNFRTLGASRHMYHCYSKPGFK